jgi:hypothetical protein
MKTKNTVVIIFILCFIYKGAFSQCNSWINAGGTSIGYGAWSIATDNSNNVYSTGDFYGSISFGSNTITNPKGGYSYYVNKYNTSGVYQWAIHIDLPDSGLQFPPVICSSKSALYVAGFYNDTLIFNSSKLTSQGYNCFLMKLDLNGNLIWLHNYPGGINSVYSDQALGITVSKANQVCITGRFVDTISFDSHQVISPGNFTGAEAFLVQTDTNGNAIWAEASTSTSSFPSNRGWGMATDNNDNIIITGVVLKDITFGSHTFTTGDTTGYCPYLAKFDSAGNCLWIHGGTGPHTFSPSYSAVPDSAGNIYFGGVLDTTMIFGPYTLYKANGDMFYCKYSPAGRLMWAKQAGASLNNDNLSSLKMAVNGDVWLTGWIGENMSFGSYNITLKSPNILATFMAEIDTSGTFVNAIGSTGTSTSYSSAIDNDGNLYIGGSSDDDTVGFQGDTIINVNNEFGDFVLKYCTTPSGINSITESKTKITVYPNPSNGVFTVEIISEQMSAMNIEVFNSIGESIYSQLNIASKAFNINLSTQPDGIYFYRVLSKTGNLLGDGKIIIER